MRRYDDKCFPTDEGGSLTIVAKQMHKAVFDDSLSGTTAICVLFDHAVITTANAGDSRAIIGVMNAEGKLEAKPLSFDQTPFRKVWFYA